MRRSRYPPPPYFDAKVFETGELVGEYNPTLGYRNDVGGSGRAQADATNSLAEATSALAEATSALAEATSALAEATTSLAEATTSLAEVTTSLNDSERRE